MWVQAGGHAESDIPEAKPEHEEKAERSDETSEATREHSEETVVSDAEPEGGVKSEAEPKEEL